ncbi:MAG: bifunctional metallophosphatase/5'-nucleotidase [Clostridia bacterium]|nr:bifunctional metallophosphatase/5'-nucleotidase [Clostridia bacterium]
MKRLLSLTLAVLMLFSLCFTVSANKDPITYDATVLFTHDLHSHLLPSAHEDGGQFGGYARLMTAINQQKAKYPDAVLVDGGDFSMGSLFQTAFATSAIELRMMGAMGYDATTFGNHEFDYLPKGLASMLNAAVNSKDKLPAIVDANYLPPKKGEEGYNEEITAAFDNYGVKDYVILQRGGVCYAVFGIFGYDADDCAPNSGMVMQEPIEKAKATVEKATAECVEKFGVEPVVICLSHSGTEDGEGEDYELAKNVEGIHLIVSGHTHTTLDKPIEVNGTYIVSAAEYGKNLGVVNLSYNAKGQVTLKSYELIPIDEAVAEDATIAAMVEGFKADVEKNYLSKYGVSFDEVLVNNGYKFDTVDEVYATQHESTLGNLYSDAYKWAVEQTTGDKVDVALTATGVIRESIPLGDVTVSDVFNAASLGVGTEGELVAVYITGKDLKNALEVDASVQPLMRSAQLFFSGVEYSFNTKRMIFNKVDYAMLQNSDGTLEKIDDKKLYRIVTGMYAGQMLGAVKSTSMGLLEITPRDKDGNPIEVADLKNYVVKDENGTPLKEWYAISSYLKNMGGKMDAKYSKPDGRKVVYSSLNPINLLSNANIFTYVLLLVILLLIAGIVLLTRFIVRKIKRKKQAAQ